MALQAAEAPNSLKKLRACVNCRLIKTTSQWQASICENCSADDAHNLSKPGARLDWMLTNTNEQFVGTIAMTNPSKSWVRRWTQMQRITNDGRSVMFVPGVYAVEVPPLLSAGARDEADRYEDEVEADNGEMDDFIADDDEEGEFDAPQGSAAASSSAAAPRVGTAALNDEYDSEDDGDYEAAPGDEESDGEGTSSDSDDDGGVRNARASSGVGVGGALEEDSDSD